MIRERKSSREIIVPLAAFKALGFHKACKMAGVHVGRRK